MDGSFSLQSSSTMEALAQCQAPYAIVWLRRDLRLEDQRVLYEALKQHERVLLLFIWEKELFDAEHLGRAQLVHETLLQMKKTLEERGSSLLFIVGDPLDIWPYIAKHTPLQAIHVGKCYDPRRQKQDQQLQQLLRTHGIAWHQKLDHLVLEPHEVLQNKGVPYKVYTPYMKRWKVLCKDENMAPYTCKPYYNHFYPLAPFVFPALQELVTSPVPTITLPASTVDLACLHHYAEQRDTLALPTSHLGIHLRFGTVSLRQLTRIAKRESEAWLNQLIWRHFFMHILAHYPDVVDKPFKPAYAHIPWRHDHEGFQRWCEGRTGFPLVDAGMRELNATGQMHNRARMVSASFLVKNLLIDWRWGEAYFAQHLLDYELALNNGNWQWVAGCGCDAAPYFRIFNPERQADRFDPQGIYIKRWVPEYGTPEYPAPMIDYAMSRERALATYRAALLKHLRA